MTDLRAAILARVDQLETLAREADVDYDGIIINFVSAMSQHMDTWDPAAVLLLASGIREIVEVHSQASGPTKGSQCGCWHFDYSGEVTTHTEGRCCEGCGFDGSDPPNHEYTIDDCPTLEAVARMLGIDPDGDERG